MMPLPIVNVWSANRVGNYRSAVVRDQSPLEFPAVVSENKSLLVGRINGIADHRQVVWGVRVIDPEGDRETDVLTEGKIGICGHGHIIKDCVAAIGTELHSIGSNLARDESW